MPNTIKHTKRQRNKIHKMYAEDRLEGGVDKKGNKFNGHGKYKLREIAEATGVPLASVNAIAKGFR